MRRKRTVLALLGMGAIGALFVAWREAASLRHWCTMRERVTPAANRVSQHYWSGGGCDL